MEDIQFFKARKFYEVDPKIKFLVGFIGSIFMLFIENEFALLIAFITGVAWCIYCGKWKNAVVITILYTLLYWWTIAMLNNPESQSSGFIVMTVLLRRFMLIACYVTPFATMEVGVLVASLKKMHLPKMFIMSIAILFRFFPTIQEEYRSVRTSQKFRGIGRNILNIIAHPITFYETLVVPLAIRIMRVSDELSASAILRGADKKHTVTSFRNVYVNALDVIVFILFICGITLSFLVNYGIVFKEVIL